MNTFNNIGSSETTREALFFNFAEYKKIKPSHIIKLDKVFLEWFIGFTEGNGSFIIKKPTVSNKKNQLVFTIVQKDEKLLKKVKTTLGFGSVSLQKDRQIYRYDVFKLNDITRLIHLFNGNIVLQKVWKKFEIWVNTYNSLITTLTAGVFSTKVIICKPYSRECCLQSGWLSGFVEADGDFYVNFRNHSKSKLGYCLSFKFYITQKFEQKILETIGNLFRDSRLKNRKPISLYKYKSKTDVYRLDITNHNDIRLIISYFDLYPLKGKKHITFIRWKRVFNQREKLTENFDLSEKSLLKLKNLVYAIQNKKKLKI